MAGTPRITGLTVESVSMVDPIGPEFSIQLGWDIVDSFDYIGLEKQDAQDGTWDVVTEAIEGTADGYLYEAAPYDQRTDFRVRGYKEATGWGSYSNIAYWTIWYVSSSDTSSPSDQASWTYSGSDSEDISDTSASVSDNVTDNATYYEEVSDTATASDSVMDVEITQLNVGRFLGTGNGKLYLYDTDYYADGSSVITSWWESKDIDMDDQYPQFIGKYKYLHGVKLRFIDLDEHDVTVGISTDGGTTWVTNTKTVGTGSGIPKEKIFNFWLHGRTFMVRVTHASSDKQFQWTDLELQFEPAGDYFEVG